MIVQGIKHFEAVLLYNMLNSIIINFFMKIMMISGDRGRREEDGEVINTLGINNIYICARM